MGVRRGCGIEGAGERVSGRVRRVVPSMRAVLNKSSNHERTLHGLWEIFLVCA